MSPRAPAATNASAAWMDSGETTKFRRVPAAASLARGRHPAAAASAWPEGVVVLRMAMISSGVVRGTGIGLVGGRRWPWPLYLWAAKHSRASRAEEIKTRFQTVAMGEDLLGFSFTGGDGVRGVEEAGMDGGGRLSGLLGRGTWS